MGRGGLMEVRRETVEISGGRKLYRYAFVENGTELPPVTEATIREEAERRATESNAGESSVGESKVGAAGPDSANG
ncbi:MAG: hypothetical protein SFX74_06090 [Fimbriimonadaceae bacterium]|nr:hypothetical protein [Fimbriimonadaceae bacterium]